MIFKFKSEWAKVFTKWCKLAFYIFFISCLVTSCNDSSNPNPPIDNPDPPINNPNPPIDNPDPPTNNPNPPVNDSAIDKYLTNLSPWRTPRVRNVDNRELINGVFNDNETTYDCTVETKQLDPNTTTYRDIMLAGISADVLYPGALLQGKQIEKGVLRSVRLPRSPITITTNLNIDDPSITVASPTTASMREAVSTLIRRADTRLGAHDVIPGNIFFNRVEGHSYEQAINSVGISALEFRVVQVSPVKPSRHDNLTPKHLDCHKSMFILAKLHKTYTF